MLSDAGPRVVGDRAGVGEHLGRGPHLRGRDAGDLFERVSRVWRAQLPVGVQHGPAADGTGEGRHRHLSLECPRRAVYRCVRCGLRTPGKRVPDHVPVRFAAGDEVALAQQSRLRCVDEIRGVGQIAHEVAVVPAFLKHDVRNPEGERAVGPRSDPQPEIRLVRGAGPARIDDDELRAASTRIGHLPGLRDPGCARVVPPQQRASSVLPVGGADVRAVGVGARDILVPVADLGAVAVVRAAEGMHQPLHPLDGVRHRRSARSGDGERDGLGTGIGREPAHLAGDGVERLDPRDPHPSGVGIALGPGALHRIQDAVRTFDLFRRGLALRAERAAGRVGRVAFDLDQPAVSNHRDAAAPRSAQGAPARYAGVLCTCFSHWHFPHSQSSGTGSSLPCTTRHRRDATPPAAGSARAPPRPAGRGPTARRGPARWRRGGPGG